MKRILFATIAGGALLACSSNSSTSGFTGGDASTGTAGGDSGSVPPIFGTGEAGAAPTCVPSPGNYDVPGNGCDDDGDGKVDNPPSCDAALATDGDARAFARALGLCQDADAAHWGVVSASFVKEYKADGSGKKADDRQHGLLPDFGPGLHPREGQSLAVLSSGWGRRYDCDGCTGSTFEGDSLFGSGSGTVPAGFPKPADGCPQDKKTNDVIDFRLVLKVPSNAKGIAFDFDFYSSEWPEFVCTNYNDAFIAYLASTAFNGGAPDNMSFDAKKNPVSVNNGFFDRCTPGVTTGCRGNKHETSTCPSGAGELAGTGFAATQEFGACEGKPTTATSGGATGWLTSQAPVTPGETITLDFIIWDTGDQVLDSTVLLDHLTWLEGPTQTGTGRPPA